MNPESGGKRMRMVGIIAMLLAWGIQEISAGDAIPASFAPSLSSSSPSATPATISPEPVVPCRPWDEPPDLRCAFAKKHCNNINFNFQDYLELFYCSRVDLRPFAIILELFLSGILFFVLVTTTADYFVPPLRILSDRMGLSQNVAGVTLLALGNGAPDLFSCFAGLNAGATGIAFGGLFGGGCFIVTVVVGLITLVNRSAGHEQIRVGTVNFIRDICTYIIAIILVIVILHDRKIYRWEALAVLGYYFLFLTFVVLFDRYTRRKRMKDLGVEDKLILNLSTDRGLAGDQIDITHDSPDVMEKIAGARDVKAFFGDELAELLHPSHSVITLIVPTQRSGVGSVDFYISVQGDRLTEKQPFVYHNSGNTLPHSFSEFSPLLMDGKPFKQGWYGRVMEFSQWNEKSIFLKIMYILSFPLIVIRICTVPPIIKEGPIIFYNKWVAAAYVVPSTIFLSFASKQDMISLRTFEGTPVPIVATVLAFDLLLIATILCVTTSKAQPRFILIYVVISWIISLAWVFVLSEEIVSLLQTFGVITNRTQTFIGMTVLSWANSAADTTADTVIARLGYGEMAITAGFAGPLLNLLLGVGISLTIITLTKGNPYIVNLDPIIDAAFILLLVALGVSLMFVGITKFRVTISFGITQILLYAAFLVTILLLEFGGYGKMMPSPHGL